MSYSINPDQGLVVVKLEGVVTIEELVSLQDQLRADLSFGPSFRMLTDASGVTDLQLDSSKVRRLADNTPFAAGARRAVIAAPGAVFGLFRMFEIMSDRSGIRTQVFLERGEALEWLNQSNRE